MTEPVSIALVNILPPTIAAIGALVVGLWNIIKSQKIQHTVNGHTTAMRENLATALARVEKLELLVVQLAGSKEEVEKAAEAVKAIKGVRDDRRIPRETPVK